MHRLINFSANELKEDEEKKEEEEEEEEGRRKVSFIYEDNHKCSADDEMKGSDLRKDCKTINPFCEICLHPSWKYEYNMRMHHKINKVVGVSNVFFAVTETKIRSTIVNR